MAAMSPSHVYLGAPAPLAATFSSRGPNLVTQDILKVIMIICSGVRLSTSIANMLLTLQMINFKFFHLYNY